MNTTSFKTYSAKPGDVEQAWHVVDAENVVVGRLAARVATILRGKHKPEYTPHMDVGDYVVIVNAEKVRFTGKKETDKQYYRHSGYPGGIRSRTPKEVRATHPERIIEGAIKGMLPRTKLGRDLYRKLHVYAGPDHPHAAQQPQTLDI
jgi:large subunit ribosomal protein L13